jgi:hypothetical protein
MSQRFSEYERREGDDYPTPPWVTRAILGHLDWPLVGTIWEPAVGQGKLVNVLLNEGYTAVGTSEDFLLVEKPPSNVQMIITNPPYGPGGRTAVKFIEKALSFPTINTVAMLLQIDFDSGSTRKHLFQDCSDWAMKVVLLRRIIFFVPPPPKKPGSSTNHAWFVWRRGHSGPANIRYAE